MGNTERRKRLPFGVRLATYAAVPVALAGLTAGCSRAPTSIDLKQAIAAAGSTLPGPVVKDEAGVVLYEDTVHEKKSDYDISSTAWKPDGLGNSVVAAGHATQGFGKAASEDYPDPPDCKTTQIGANSGEVQMIFYETGHRSTYSPQKFDQTQDISLVGVTPDGF